MHSQLTRLVLVPLVIGFVVALASRAGQPPADRQLVLGMLCGVLLGALAGLALRARGRNVKTQLEQSWTERR